MIDVVEICREVLVRLSMMNYETNCRNSNDKLIFPYKKQAKGNIDRISEQELRLVFIEEFKNKYPNHYYSIETPTLKKYRFKDTENLKTQSALHDMCVFEKTEDSFHRILNIEFKHKTAEKSIEKDIYKLVHEEQSGVFILLLKNTNKGTINSFCKKLSKSLVTFKLQWNSDKDKFLQIVIISLQINKKQNGVPFLKHLKIVERDLETIKSYNYEWI